MEQEREIHSDSMIFRITEESILDMCLRPGWTGIVTLAHARRDLDCIQEISAGSLYPIFVRVPNVVVSKEARDFYSTHPPVTLAAALFVSNSFQRILGNFFLGLNKVKIPLQLFTSEKQARQWLLLKKELHLIHTSPLYES